MNYPTCPLCDRFHTAGPCPSRYAEIERAAMPAHSFRYGQLASIEGVDAPADAWLVCTNCAHFEGDVSTTVLVAHFIRTDESEAREIAADLARSNEVTLVRPVPNGSTVAEIDAAVGPMTDAEADAVASPKPVVSHVGGSMYGDGEYVVEFRNASSFLVPLSADVMTPSGKLYEVTMSLGDKPSVATARSIIAQVRARENA